MEYKYTLEFDVYYLPIGREIAAIRKDGTIEGKVIKQAWTYSREDMTRIIKTAVTLGGEVFVTIPIIDDEEWAGFTIRLQDLVGVNI